MPDFDWPERETNRLNCASCEEMVENHTLSRQKLSHELADRRVLQNAENI